MQTPEAAMLLQLFRHPCRLVARSDYFFAGIPILGRFLGQPVSLGFTGFSFSLSLSLSFFFSCPPLREAARLLQGNKGDK